MKFIAVMFSAVFVFCLAIGSTSCFYTAFSGKPHEGLYDFPPLLILDGMSGIALIAGVIWYFAMKPPRGRMIQREQTGYEPRRTDDTYRRYCDRNAGFEPVVGWPASDKPKVHHVSA